MRGGVVAKSDADDARFRVLRDPDAGEFLVRFGQARFQQNVNGGAARIFLEMVELVFDAEFFRDALQDRVVRFQRGHIK